MLRSPNNGNLVKAEHLQISHGIWDGGISISPRPWITSNVHCALTVSYESYQETLNEDDFLSAALELRLITTVAHSLLATARLFEKRLKVLYSD